MVRPLRRPVGLPAIPRLVVLPGHRPQPHAGAYRAGVAQYRCTCGSETVPAPPTTAAALWREHLEINMARSTMFAGEPGAHAGKSILELLWDEMDTAYAELMENPDKKKLQGRCGGIAEALALMINPYNRDVDAVRESAHLRWEDAQQEDEEEGDQAAS